MASPGEMTSCDTLRGWLSVISSGRILFFTLPPSPKLPALCKKHANKWLEFKKGQSDRIAN